MLTSALLGVFVTGAVSFFVTPIANAISFDSTLGATFGLGTRDLLETVINIVQWALGLLGLVAVIIIMYGGFVWMTAKGNQDKIAKAKKIIFNGLIGLAIVLLSWAIVFFVMRTIDDATSGGSVMCGAAVCSETCCPGNICATSCGSGSFPTADLEITGFEASRETQPSGPVTQCSSIKAVFNVPINPATVEAAELPDNLRTEDIAVGGPFASTTDDFLTSARTVTYYHDSLFNAGDYEEWYPTTGTPIQDLDFRNISVCDDCTDGPDPWKWDFTVGNETDITPPEIDSTYPIFSGAGYPDRNVSRAPIFTLHFDEPIDDNSIMDASGHPKNNFELWECTDDSCGSFVSQYSNNNLLVQSISQGVNIYIENPAVNPLNSFTWYQIRVQGVEDLCTNPMVGQIVWEFETNDAVPGVVSWYPTGLNECPSTDIYITFGTSMYNQTLQITIDNGTDFRQSPPLSPSTIPSPGPYYVQFGNNFFEAVDTATPNDFKVFRLRPDPDLVANSAYIVNVATNMVIDINGNYLSKQWGFSVTDPASCTCSPYVAYFSPTQGPRESCVTIQGACFKGTPANPAVPTHIIFDDNVRPQQSVVPALGTYDDNYITTKIPAVYDNNDRPQVQVELDYDNPSYGVLYSAAYYLGGPNFFVNSTEVSDGPCLWSISPTSGYVGTGMNATGERFGATQGSGHIDYGGGVSGVVGGWSDTAISTSVPAGAVSGDVTVTSDVAGPSNGINFTVLTVPPGTPYVVINNFCDQYTLSSPSPWPDYQEVCRNVKFSARFSENMNPSTINGANVFFQPCNDASCLVVGAALTGALTMPTGDTFEFDPSAFLNPNTWYRGTITTGVRSLSSNTSMATDYVWKFRTKLDTTECGIEAYNLIADTYFLYTVNSAPNAMFTSSAIGPACQILSGTYDWNWNANVGTVPPYVAERVLSSGPTVSHYQGRNEGSGMVRAWISGSSIPPVERLLTVDPTFCEDSIHCNSLCSGSTCVNNHCTPIIQSIVPNPSPIGTGVTINGCMFGSYTGLAGVDFSGSPGPWVPTSWPACGPAGTTWTDTSIVVEVPNEDTPATFDDAVDGPIRIRNSYGERDYTNTPPGPIISFDVDGPFHPTLCYFNPSSGTQGQLNATEAVGEDFGTDGTIDFTSSAGRSDSPGFTSWDETSIQEIDLPADALTGTGIVHSTVPTVGDSNPVPFGITCNVNSDCTSGCCFTGMCSDLAMCSTGEPGALCQIPDNTSCLSGPLSFPAGYRCISDTGDIYPETPPPPGPQGADCRSCCMPGTEYNGLTCLSNQDGCTGPARGLYCGCATDDQCGAPNTIGCGDMGGTMCCTGRPAVLNVDPFDGEPNVCTNRSIVVEFNQIMDASTFNSSTFIVEDASGTPYTGTIDSYNDGIHTFLVFYSDTEWNPSESHTITINGESDINDGVHDGVLNQYQVGMDGIFTSTFDTDADRCLLDHVEISIQYGAPYPAQPVAFHDMYTCIQSNCTGDVDPVAGNQHRYLAWAKNEFNANISGGTWNWNNSVTNGVLNISLPNSPSTLIGTDQGLDGTAMIRADVTMPSGGGSGFAVVQATVQACQDPWPTIPPFFFSDPAPSTNFTDFYCREGGLPGTADPMIISRSPVDPLKDELLKEMFFSICKDDDATCISSNTSGDVIGIRVMENGSFLSPTAWFNQIFPEDTGSCVPIGTVDGYQACRAGRTIYVAASNHDGTTLWPNIYLISYNEGASGQTINIYNQLVQNWYFNSGPSLMNSPCAGGTNKDCIVRDTKRVTDIGEIGYLLLNYGYHNSGFPELSAGTFLSGFTSSKWPSWMAEFGNAIGMNPPLDPINEFSGTPACSVPPYDPSGTCWNDAEHTFNCPNTSKTYAYQYDSSNPKLFTRLEYSGLGAYNSGIRSDRLYSGNPCAGYAGSNCSACFNYSAEAADGTNGFWINNWQQPN